MNSAELKQVVEQRSDSSAVLGRIACNLKGGGDAAQSHSDDRQFTISWQELEGFRRCTIGAAGGKSFLARLDLHDNATVRADIREPCSLMISPDDDLLCLTRLP